MNHIELICELKEPPPECRFLVDFAAGILRDLNIENWQIGLVLTDDKGIRAYNRQWRDRDEATDVLSFVQDEGMEFPVVPGVPKEAGDIIISLERVRANAERWANTYDEELRRVTIHGILHLKGMDHPGDDYEGEMLKLQENLLSRSRNLMKDGE